MMRAKIMIAISLLAGFALGVVLAPMIWKWFGSRFFTVTPEPEILTTICDPDNNSNLLVDIDPASIDDPDYILTNIGYALYDPATMAEPTSPQLWLNETTFPVSFEYTEPSAMKLKLFCEFSTVGSTKTTGVIGPCPPPGP
jgi:hypothetical protein